MYVLHNPKAQQEEGFGLFVRPLYIRENDGTEEISTGHESHFGDVGVLTGQVFDV